MSKLRGKPVNHGRDHMPGGSDPIPGAGGGGIQFDTEPQTGEWLYVETDGPATTGAGFGMEFFDQGGNGIDVSTGSCHLRLNEFGSGDAALITAGALTLTGTGGVNIGASADILIHAVGTAELRAQTVAFGPTPVVKLHDMSTNISLQLTDSKLILIDEDTAQQILLIDASDSSYHILTGASWVADL